MTNSNKGECMVIVGISETKDGAINHQNAFSKSYIEYNNLFIVGVEEEAKHIKETREFIEEYKSKVANTNSTSAKGKNVNDKTSNTSNATGSVNTDNNKSKKVKSNKPKVNPVKNKNKNMITSWRQKDDNSGETKRQHDSITELYKEKNKR